jgi:hypothetical protein
MEITVLHVPDCPNLDPVLNELAGLVGGRDDISVTTRMVSREEEAAELDFQGSPTILIDGRDAFPMAAGNSSLACRTTIPSREQLEQAIGRAG